ncbi:MAG: beta-ketoacyl-[acyl-carrier-protein] synthase family protein [Candidatus Brocadiae bacterium]|nr:beta-ketoacyl-[acyl-carrier-protein] synthase family protein [Candidatus Brocadiia bacterium]
MEKNRVVITGMGIISNLGTSFVDVMNSLRTGYSRIIISEERKKKGFRSALTSELPPLDTKSRIDRRIRKFLSEAALYSVWGWLNAVDECQLNVEHFTGKNVGIVLGNDSSSEPIPELMAILDKYKETHFLGANMVIKTMNSCCSMNLGPIIGAQGINITISAACASGAHAIGYSHSLLQSNQQEAIVTGGFQEMNWLSMSSFDALGAFSTNPDPTKASRPFDYKRDGLVPGGGGAVLILETLERAKRLQHKIYGEILSYGFSSDGSHLTIPTGDGAERCMRNALEQARISPLEIDYIHAHATSTPVGDRAEAGAIHKIFGSNGPVVSSTKSMTGHECWMAGASSVIYCLAMMQGGFIAPSINFDHQEEDACKINITNKTIQEKPRTILCNSFGFGGTNASIILKEFIE